jgi:transposase
VVGLLGSQLRDCEYSIQEGDVYFSWRLKRLFLKAIALHKRRHRPFVLSNLAKWYCRLEDELTQILEFEPETPSGKRLKKRYLKHGDSLFTFLKDPQAIPATNNGSERAIRLSTIYRRVTGGFRSDWGKHLFASVRSVVNTGQRQKLTPRQSIQRTLGTQPGFFLT